MKTKQNNILARFNFVWIFICFTFFSYHSYAQNICWVDVEGVSVTDENSIDAEVPGVWGSKGARSLRFLPEGSTGSISFEMQSLIGIRAIGFGAIDTGNEEFNNHPNQMDYYVVFYNQSDASQPGRCRFFRGSQASPIFFYEVDDVFTIEKTAAEIIFHLTDSSAGITSTHAFDLTLNADYFVEAAIGSSIPNQSIPNITLSTEFRKPAEIFASDFIWPFNFDDNLRHRFAMQKCFDAAFENSDVEILRIDPTEENNGSWQINNTDDGGQVIDSGIDITIDNNDNILRVLQDVNINGSIHLDSGPCSPPTHENYRPLFNILSVDGLIWSRSRVSVSDRVYINMQDQDLFVVGIEHRHNISICSSQNITFNSIHFTNDYGGDCIYISANHTPPQGCPNVNSNNIKIIRCIFEDYLRNGIAVASCEETQILYCTFNHIDKTYDLCISKKEEDGSVVCNRDCEFAAIDIETHKPAEVVGSVIINKCNFNNVKVGVRTGTSHTPGKSIDVDVEYCTFKNVGYVATLGQSPSHVDFQYQGSVEYRFLTVEEAINGFLLDYKDTPNLDVVIDNICMEFNPVKTRNFFLNASGANDTIYNVLRETYEEIELSNIDIYYNQGSDSECCFYDPSYCINTPNAVPPTQTGPINLHMATLNPRPTYQEKNNCGGLVYTYPNCFNNISSGACGDFRPCTIEIQSATCSGEGPSTLGSISLTGLSSCSGGNIEYVWESTDYPNTNFPNSPTIDNLQAGQYCVTISAEYSGPGCSNPDDIESCFFINQDNEDIDVPEPEVQNICQCPDDDSEGGDGNFVLKPGCITFDLDPNTVSINWYKYTETGLVSIHNKSTELCTTEPGAYCIEITPLGGSATSDCEEFICTELIIVTCSPIECHDEEGSDEGITDEENEIRNRDEKGTKLYPNPFTHTFTIESDKNIQEVSVFDLNGKIIEKMRIRDNKVQLSPDLFTGVYITRIIFEDQSTETVKLIKH